jgi:DNA-binding LytR/AlgR family response regulator
MLAQQVIQSHLQKAERFELIGVCSNAMEAQELLNKHEVDLMFLDIQLPGMTGLNFLRSLTNPPLVVVTTAYAEYALESYEFNVIDYLLKPISFDRFSKTINKIVDGKFLLQNKAENGDVTGDHIFIKSNSKFFKIDFPDIIYIEGMKDYLEKFIRRKIYLLHTRRCRKWSSCYFKTYFFVFTNLISLPCRTYSKVFMAIL